MADHMVLPRILVFDDMAGWLPDHRARLCERFLLRDVTEAPVPANHAKDESDCLAEAVFHPAQTLDGRRVRNSVDAALGIVRQGWEKPCERPWALVLLDLQFDEGEVAGTHLNVNTNWPQTSVGDFGLRILEALKDAWPDAQRPGRTAVPVAALSRSRHVAVETSLNDLGNLGYLEIPDEQRTQGTQRRRFSEILFHFGLFPDGPLRVVHADGQLRTLKRDSRIWGHSRPLLQALRTARQAAMSAAPCLLQGPVGSGKGEFAKLVHDLSPRSSRPFVQQDCASLPETLLELELFGYAKKAGIQGANPDGKMGSFEAADKGTLFLDEIGVMTPVNRAKLLVTIQEGKVKRLGAKDVTPIDVRLLAATNVDLEKAVEKNEFNDALYSRLHSLIVRVPSLEERKEDIALLFTEFVERATTQIGGERSKVYPEDTIKLLSDRRWRFNVRELENMAKKIAVERKYSKVIAPNDVRL